MKTFFHLIQEVQKPGFCHHCGGCVSFCTAVNYGALKTGEDGKPGYADMEKCIECGLCYSICPEISELDEAIKNQAAWSVPLGRVIETSIARSADKTILEKGTDGGVVTAILTHLMDIGKIDGAIVSKPAGTFQRQPCLAGSREEIVESAGFNFDTSHGMALFSDAYSTYSPSVHALAPMVKKGLRRVAFVGTPCQIKAIRKMQAMHVVPADNIHLVLGLFCAGNFNFGEAERQELEKMGGFSWREVNKVNLKEQLMIHLKSGEIKYIPLDELEPMKRHACRYCDDYTSEFADISFGGIGAEQGWTTVLTRTPLGRAVFADSRGEILQEYSHSDNPKYVSEAMRTIRKWSAKKKKSARENRRQFGKPVSFSQ